MRSVSIRLEDMNRMEIVIGKVAENLHTQVNFDCKKMFDAYPDAVPALSVMNPAGVCYPAIVERDGDIVTWNVTDSDLVKEGAGEVQLNFIEGETVAKSYIGRIKVTRSLVANGEVPDPVENWLDEAEAALAYIPQAIDTALEAAKESGEFDGPPGQDGRDGQDGAPGYTPQKGVDYFDGQDGYTPVKGVDYFDGQDGQDGAPGADGVSPTVTVTDITGGHRVVITDAEGDHQFDVMDGSNPVPPQWELIRSGTGTNASASSFEIALDNYGEPFELTDVMFVLQTPKQSVQSGVGSYGRIYFYFGNGTYDYDTAYIGAYTQAANADLRTSTSLITQTNGLRKVEYLTNTTGGGDGSTRMHANLVPAGSADGLKVVNTPFSYKRVVIAEVTGTFDFALYGRRKPQ